MPDHLHLLAEGREAGSDFTKFVSEAKQRSAYASRPWVRGRVWQEGYFERVLRDDEQTFDVARYIVQNPVRAGLVTSPMEYPFLGSDTLSIRELVESTM